MDFKEIQPVHSKGDQFWVFFGRNDAEAETPVLWPPHGKSWLIGKDSDAGRDCGQEKGMTEDEMAGWHHGLNGRESEWTLRVGDGQGVLACCDSWGRKELEKEMATHSSVLAWRIPGTREPGGLPSMGSHRVGHNWSDLAAKNRTRLSDWTELNWEKGHYLHSNHLNLFQLCLFWGP